MAIWEAWWDFTPVKELLTCWKLHTCMHTYASKVLGNYLKDIKYGETIIEKHFNKPWTEQWNLVAFQPWSAQVFSLAPAQCDRSSSPGMCSQEEKESLFPYPQQYLFWDSICTTGEASHLHLRFLQFHTAEALLQAGMAMRTWFSSAKQPLHIEWALLSRPVRPTVMKPWTHPLHLNCRLKFQDRKQNQGRQGVTIPTAVLIEYGCHSGRSKPLYHSHLQFSVLEVLPRGRDRLHEQGACLQVLKLFGTECRNFMPKGIFKNNKDFGCE